MSKMGALRIAS